MQLTRCLLSNFCHKTFRASLCPSSGEQDRVLLHMVLYTSCAGCGCVELGRKLCVLCESNSNLHTVHTAYDPALHNHSQHNLCRTPTICGSTRSCSLDDGHNDVRNMLRLKFDNKHRVRCNLLVSLSSSYVHDARSEEPKIYTAQMRAGLMDPATFLAIVNNMH